VIPSNHASTGRLVLVYGSVTKNGPQKVRNSNLVIGVIYAVLFLALAVGSLLRPIGLEWFIPECVAFIGALGYLTFAKPGRVLRDLLEVDRRSASEGIPEGTRQLARRIFWTGACVALCVGFMLLVVWQWNSQPDGKPLYPRASDAFQIALAVSGALAYAVISRMWKAGTLAFSHGRKRSSVLKKQIKAWRARGKKTAGDKCGAPA